MKNLLDRWKGFVLLLAVIGGVAAGSSSFDIPGLSHASGGSEFANVYIFFFFVISGAVIGRYVARKFKQPEVLGELIIGVVIGVILYQAQVPGMMLLRHQADVKSAEVNVLTGKETWNSAFEQNLSMDDATKEKLTELVESPSFPEWDFAVKSMLLLSNFGILVLLFLVGLESSIEEMLKVGGPSVLTALLGVIVPSVLGFAVSYLMLPGHELSVHLFIGATLSATSIGITARVFKDLNKISIPEAKVVLGAAVIDDVLGLILLAVVTGIAVQGTLAVSEIALIVFKAVIFIAATLYIGSTFLRQQIKFGAILDNKNLRLLFPFALLIFLAWLSEAIGLSGIVGAFAAGLIIKEEYFNDALKDKERSVKQVIEPVEAIFAPVFFVLMGIQVDIGAFASLEVVELSLLLTAAAIAGKLVSGMFTKGMDKKIIGIGMVPRGEVGLIFAGIGKSIGVLDGFVFSAIIILVILTTLMTPPSLKWAIEKK